MEIGILYTETNSGRSPDTYIRLYSTFLMWLTFRKRLATPTLNNHILTLNFKEILLCNYS